MRAVTYDDYGPADVLHLSEDVVEPHAGPGQVRIRVEAAAVNPVDWKMRSGAARETFPVDLPGAVPGSDAAGIVDEVGEGVSNVSEGDRVFGSGSRASAEYAVLDAFALAPASLSPEAAASLPMAVETAARAMGLLDLAPGDLLVLDGAAGGVGTAAVQLAVARGLVVVATASQDNQDHLRTLGALATTYGEGLPDRVRALSDAPVAGGVDLAGKGGVDELVALTGDPARVVTIADFGAGAKGVQVTGGSEAVRAWESLGEVAGLIESGRFTPVVDTVLPWTEAAAAHARSETGHIRGKIVITVD